MTLFCNISIWNNLNYIFRIHVSPRTMWRKFMFILRMFSGENGKCLDGGWCAAHNDCGLLILIFGLPFLLFISYLCICICVYVHAGLHASLGLVNEIYFGRGAGHLFCLQPSQDNFMYFGQNRNAHKQTMNGEHANISEFANSWMLNRRTRTSLSLFYLSNTHDLYIGVWHDFSNTDRLM